MEQEEPEYSDDLKCTKKKLNVKSKVKSKPKKSSPNVRSKKPNQDPPSQNEKARKQLYSNKKNPWKLGADDDVNKNLNSSITNFFKPCQSKHSQLSRSDRLDEKQGNFQKMPTKDEPQLKLRKIEPQPKNWVPTDDKFLGNKLKTKLESEFMNVRGLKLIPEIESAKSKNLKLETKLSKHYSAKEISTKEAANELSHTSSEFTGSQESEKISEGKKLNLPDLFKELSESDEEKVVKKKSKKTYKKTALKGGGGIERYFKSNETKSNEKDSKKPVMNSDDDIRPSRKAMVKAKKGLKFDDSSSDDDKAPQQRLNGKQNNETEVLLTSFDGNVNKNFGDTKKLPCLDIYNLKSSQSCEKSAQTVPNTRSKKNITLLKSSCPSSQSSQENDKFQHQSFKRIPKKKKDGEKTTSPSLGNWLSKKSQSKATTPPKKKVTVTKSNPKLNYSKLPDAEFHKQLKTAKVKNDRYKRIPQKKDDILKETKEILKTPPRPKNTKIKKDLAMIDKIGEILKINVEKNKKCKELEKKLENVLITSSPTIEKAREKLAEMNSFILESTLLKLPPGLNILDSKQYHCYLHNVCDLNDKNFEKRLPNVLNDKDIDDTREIFLDKLFKVVSSLNEDISHDVNPLLERLAKKNLEWQPKIHHIVVALINFGVTIQDCPLQELFLNQKLRLDKIGAREENIFDVELSSEEKQRKILGGSNLIMIFEFLHLCLTRGNTYDTSTLCNYITMICWIRMDKHYLEHPMVVRFQECCALALDHIPEEIWDEKKQFLSSKLSEMDPKMHHHNLAFIAEFIPATARGINLRQLTSFKMIKFLNNFPVSSVDEKFDYEILYDFLKSNPVIVNQDNYYESRSKILLINYCLDLQGDWLKEKEDSLTYLKKIGNLLRNFSMRIIDSMRQQDSTKIKNLLIEIRCKVVLYTHGRDVREASSDRLLDNSQTSPIKGQKRVRKPQNLFPIEDE